MFHQTSFSQQVFPPTPFLTTLPLREVKGTLELVPLLSSRPSSPFSIVIESLDSQTETSSLYTLIYPVQHVIAPAEW